MYVLAGDIGGTKALMAIARLEQGRLNLQYEARLPSADYSDIEPLVEAFLEQSTIHRSELAGAALAVAGPVQEEPGHTYAKLTNLPWTADSRAISKRLGDIPVTVMNDFAAVAYALPHLEQEDLHRLQAGIPRPHAPMLAVGAGTGLGVCLLDDPGGKVRVLPSEGGHVNFAPANQEQLNLLQYWMDRNGHCSREYLLSGPGISRIAEFVENSLHLEPSDALRQLMQGGDASAVISEAAVKKEDAFAIRTMQIFVDIYTSQLGDLALSYLPRGGLFIAGGIAPKILPLLQEHFLASFPEKPPMQELLKEIPVHVVTTTRIGLIGALHRAHDIASQ